MSTPECHVKTNPGSELVVMTSIFGKRELVNYICDAGYYAIQVRPRVRVFSNC